MAYFAHITGWGMMTPDMVLTNDDISKKLDTNDEWIQARTGIRERRIADSEQTTASLAADAALRALEKAGISPVDVDMIIVSTSSPEHIFPSTASLVQDSIGANKAGAFDLLAACTGFIYALDVATQSIQSGSIKTAVVIGAETLSRMVNWEDRNTCILFGDGAGAFVLQASEEKGGVLSSVLRSDGSGGDLLSVPAGGSKLPTTVETIRDGLHYIQMNGREVFRFATRVMANATREAVANANLEMNEISLVIPHQANLRIIEAAARNLKLPIEQFVINLDRYGNTSTASIPIATCEAIEGGRISPGDRIVLVGFGGCLTWGASVIQWAGPLLEKPSVWPYRFIWLYGVYTRVRSLFLRIARQIEGLIWGAQK